MKRPWWQRCVFLLPWTVALAGLGWIGLQRFPLSGTISFDVPFDGSSAWMDPFLPSERVTSPGVQSDGWRGQRVLGDPVYSSARIPGSYDSVTLEMEYRPNGVRLAEIGILRDEATLATEFVPMWFSQLATGDWKLEEAKDGYRGYIKRGTSIDLLSSSDYSKLALWYGSSTPLLTEDSADIATTTRISLRGAFDIWAIPADGEILFSFSVQDSNRRTGSDAIVLQIVKGSEIIKTEAIGIGGSRDEKMGLVTDASIRAKDLKAGAYRVRVIAEDDVFVRSITTSAKHWVIGPRISFGDMVGYSTSSQSAVVWTNSRHLVLETVHEEGLQRVSLGKDAVDLVETHSPMYLTRTNVGTSIQKLEAPNGDLRVIGDGFFSLSPDAFFIPEPRRITAYTDIDAEGISAILTSANLPESLGDGWYRSAVTFALDSSQDRARFTLSLPDIASASSSMDIRRVKLTYARPALSFSEWLRVLRSEVSRAWRHIRS